MYSRGWRMVLRYMALSGGMELGWSENTHTQFWHHGCLSRLHSKPCQCLLAVEEMGFWARRSVSCQLSVSMHGLCCASELSLVQDLPIQSHKWGYTLFFSFAEGRGLAHFPLCSSLHMLDPRNPYQQPLRLPVTAPERGRLGSVPAVSSLRLLRPDALASASVGPFKPHDASGCLMQRVSFSPLLRLHDFLSPPN